MKRASYRGIFLFLAILLADCRLLLAQPATDYSAQVQIMYIAYYGRPGDPGGIAFWSQQLADAGGSLQAIVESFGNSDEYVERFGSLADEVLVNNVYQQLFGRDADNLGLDFYLASLQSGERSLASIALDIANGVQSGTDDAAIVDNKLAVANAFTTAVAELEAEYGSEQIDPARNLLADVDGSQDSVQIALAALDLLFNGTPGQGQAFDYFVDNISDDVLQTTCITCHVAGGLAQASRLVYVPATVPDYHTRNYQQWENLALQQDSLTSYALNKAQGIDHGGGVQLSVGSESWSALQTFLNLLTGSGGEPAPGVLFEGYSATGSADTLRRAAMIVAGVIPDATSLEQVNSAGDTQLRSALRGLMAGEGFHKFLIEGANDRLLTDKWIGDQPVELLFQPYFPDLANFAAEISTDGQLGLEELKLIRGISWGVARQPLELIAHVVEQELPYTEILTADYTLVNPQLALAFRSPVEFPDDVDIDQWQISTVEGYTRIGPTTMYERAEGIGAYVSGGLATEYPQAGLLNTPGWLARYPSTDTNRNRARARWTWYHFLGFDIEKSAPRTTDPAALADTDNPTLKNPNCIVCHELLDPVAGAYQNYGDDGFYKDQPGGVDSLPRLYKRDRNAEIPYTFGDVWYTDMRPAGIFGQPLEDTRNTLQQFAAQVVRDHGFAVGTVKFWWPALMGEEAVNAPENPEDLDYQQQLALYQAQSADIELLAQSFEKGFAGGSPHNLKDLLVEMIMSPWFRIDQRIGESSVEDTALLHVGTGKLLTPEQLDRKTAAVTGFRWYEEQQFGVETSQLDGAYRLFYGGIDSDGVTVRATEMTALMSTVVEAQPLQMACILVGLDFNLPNGQRRLFSLVSRNQHESNAEAAIRSQLQQLHQRFLGEELAADDPEINRTLALFGETRAERIELGYPAQLNGSTEEACPYHLIPASRSWDLADPDHVMNSWVSLLIYFMTDFNYIYE